MNRYSRLFSRRLGFSILSADKGGSGGGGGTPSVADLNAQIKTLEGEKATLTTEKAGLETKVTAAESAKTKAEAELATANTEKEALQTKLDTSVGESARLKGEVAKLQGEAKTVDQKAQEIAASHNSKPAGKDLEEAGNQNADGKELFDQYMKLDGREAATFWKTHEKALMAYQQAEEQRERRRND